MGMLGSVVLLILGVLATESVLVRHRPDLRFWVSLLRPFSGHLGLGAVLYGLYLTVRMVAYLGFIRYAPVVYLLGIASGLVLMSLGVIYGAQLMKDLLGARASDKQVAALETVRLRLCVYQTALGWAGLLLGAMGLLLNLFV